MRCRIRMIRSATLGIQAVSKALVRGTPLSPQEAGTDTLDQIHPNPVADLKW